MDYDRQHLIDPMDEGELAKLTPEDRDAYESDRAAKTDAKEKALVELWETQGRSAVDKTMPSVVLMEYDRTSDTRELRRNAQESMVERSIEKLRAEPVQSTEGDGKDRGS